MGRVEPAPVVAHEVPQPEVRRGRVLEERERAIDDRRPDLLVAPTCELERDDGEAGDVVDAVPALAVRNDPVRVLDDPDVVDEREQVVGSHRDALPVEGDGTSSARRQLDRLAEDRRGRRGHRRPRELLADAPCLGAGGHQRRRLLDVVAHGASKGGGVGERHDRAGAGLEHVLRVPVGRRHDPAAGCDREGERARRDLLPGAVGRDEDVGGGKQIGDLVDAQEPVVELDMALETEVEHRPLERHPVALPLAVRDVGVRPAGDQVEHVRVLLDDRRQRLDHRLEPLAGGDQAEGREQEAVVEPTGRAPRACRLAEGALDRELARAAGEHRRCAVRHDADLLERAGPAVDEQVAGRVRHHDHELGLAADGGEHARLMGRRLGQHRVQGHDERLGQLLDERRDVAPVAPPEDAVLVLQEDDVDIEPAEDPCGADIVATNTLRDRGHEPRALRPRRLVDDHELLDAVDPIEAEQGAADVRCEGADAASPRRVGGDDRGAHGRPASLPSEVPARAPRAPSVSRFSLTLADAGRRRPCGSLNAIRSATVPETPVVFVTGPPASGKTDVAAHLAARLALPLIAKDAIKEALFEALGTGDAEWSRRLGRASFDLLYEALEWQLRAGRPAIVEANFDGIYAPARLAEIRSRYRLRPVRDPLHCVR